MPKTVSKSEEANPRPTRERFRIYIDFDNTISLGDVLDGVIAKFAVGDRWQELEADWDAGRIGARECLDGQLRSIRCSWSELSRHLDTVQLDPGFNQLLTLADRFGVELTIVSDNFDLILGHVLRQNGLNSVAYFANHLEVDHDQYLPAFPFSNPGCPTCAHCKKTHFLPRGDDPRAVVYIGDGRSDLCPARHADLVFAKSSLLRQLRLEGRSCYAFSSLSEVTNSLESIFHENKLQ